jgi:hypothetical protein
MNVLSSDMKMALKLRYCCRNYLNRARTELHRNDFDETERWVDEFKRCKRDLDELIKRKEEHDKLLQVVALMKEKGIDIAIILRGNEQ